MSIAMSSKTGRVLADRLFSRSISSSVALVVGGAALTALAAQISIPMWPVPMTAQTLAVLLVGTVLGPVRGLASMALYVAAGIVGLPIFTHGATGLVYFAGPTGGYLIGFVGAAFLTGYLANRSWDRKIIRTIVSFLAGSAVIYTFGLTWLSFSLGQLGYPNDLSATLAAGFLPFVIGDIVKAVAAGLLVPGTWKALNR